MSTTYTMDKIPSNHQVWSGEILTFRVTSTLGKNAQFSFRPPNPRPVGEVSFSQIFNQGTKTEEGMFVFKPSKKDIDPFTITLRATLGARKEEQQITVTPIATVENECKILSNRVEAPKRDSKTYVQTASRSAGKALKNRGMQQFEIETYDVSISGVLLVFESGKWLFDDNNNRDNIKTLNIYADEVVVRSRLRLPGTKVVIYARSLRFELDGRIDTTGEGLDTVSDKDVGVKGDDGGDIFLYVKHLTTPGEKNRFIANGGKGQAAQLGLAGDEGKSISYSWDGTYEENHGIGGIHRWSWQDKLEITQGFTPLYAFLRFAGYGNSNIYSNVGSKVWPDDGGDPKRQPGKPGEGGNGGSIHAHPTMRGRLERCSQLDPGRAGTKAQDVPAAAPGKPVQSCWVNASFTDKGEYILKVSKWHTSKPGPEGKAPDPDHPTGEQGHIKYFDNVGDGYWLHPVSTRVFLQYAYDAFLAGSTTEVRPLIDEYLAGLGSVGIFELSTLHAEMAALGQKIDGPFDYFGNPAGWVPMLSFESNLELYRSETESAIRTLFLSYWIEKNQKDTNNFADALNTAIDTLTQEGAAALDQYKVAQNQLPSIETDLANICGEITKQMNALQEKENDLLNQATGNVQWEHAIRSTVRLLGGIMQVVPAGQPALGAAGKGLSVLANLDPAEPLDTVKKLGSELWNTELVKTKLKPKALELLSQYFSVGGENKAVSKEDAKNNLKDKVEKPQKEQEDVMKQISEAIASFTAPEDEIQSMLERLKAESSDYIELLKDIEELNEKKALVVEKLLAVMQQLDSASTTFVTTQLSRIEMESQRSEKLGMLNIEARQYAQAMGQRARDRLIKYQYYLIKSYNYLMLSELPISYDAVQMFSNFEKLVESSQDGMLTLQQFADLGAVFEDKLRAITSSIVDWYQKHPQQQSVPFSVSLTSEQLAILNAKNEVTINLMDMGALFLTQENIRITGITVHQVDLEYPRDSTVNVYLDFRHSGTSIIRRGGKLFAFRTGDYSAAAVTTELHRNDRMSWGTMISHSPNEALKLTPTSPNPAETSLIRELLKNKTGSSVTPLLNYQPSAWADINIHKDLSPSGYPGTINGLVLSVSHVFHTIDQVDHTLHVLTRGGLKPVIRCDTRDVNDQTDGAGSFLRTFHGVDQVKLTAPATYGEYDFVGWNIVGDETPDILTQELDWDATRDGTVEVIYKARQVATMKA